MTMARLLLVLLLLPLAGVAQAEEGRRIVRGPTRPAQVANLGPLQEGTVRTIEVREGARVRQGDVLVRLLDDIQKARVDLSRVAAEADGELRQAQVQAEEAEAVLMRTQAAAARSAASDWEVRQARARHEIARAAVQAATDRRRVERQKLELELAALETLLIRAPFDGTVTRVDTTPGATLGRGDRPITVADLTILEAVLYVPADAWPHLRVGESYRLELSSPADQTVQAQLRHVDPILDAASGRFRAIFTIDNAGGQLPAGTEAALDLSAMKP